MDNNKLKRLVDEFCENGNAETYRSLITKIFQEILESNCEIRTRYDNKQSSHSKNYESGKSHIRISLVPGLYEKPEHLVWIILHEYGHHFKPLKLIDKDNIEKIIESEELAWDWASKRIQRIKEFESKQDEFDQFKFKYLETYYRLRSVR